MSRVLAAVVFVVATYLNTTRGADSASRATATVGIVAVAACVGCSIVANFCTVIVVNNTRASNCAAHNAIIFVLVLVAFHVVVLLRN